MAPVPGPFKSPVDEAIKILHADARNREDFDTESKRGVPDTNRLAKLKMDHDKLLDDQLHRVGEDFRKEADLLAADMLSLGDYFKDKLATIFGENRTQDELSRVVDDIAKLIYLLLAVPFGAKEEVNGQIQKLRQEFVHNLRKKEPPAPTPETTKRSQP